MAIVLPSGRPAIDIVSGTYSEPDLPWAHLGAPQIRACLEPAIAAVGRLDYEGVDTLPYGGTAFVVGRDLIMTTGLGHVFDGVAFKPGMSAFVDFGHERDRAEPLRFPVEKVLHVDPVSRLELVRVSVPDTIKPLWLSVTEPEDLEGREVALIGYPAYDPRSEASLMQQIFGGIFGVKRMLPGWARGAGVANGKPVLLHDCSSTGGAGGAPLVDVATGIVVGVHLGGVFLDRNFAVAAADLGADPAFAQIGVGFFGSPKGRGFAEIRTTTGFLPNQTGHDVVEAPKEPEGSQPDPPLTSLDAIAIPELRPSVAAENWAERVGPQWGTILGPFQKRVNLALRSVGRVVTNLGSDAWIGSAFLVGDRLAITASFATQDFVDGIGTGAVLKKDTRAAIDFSEALGLAPGSATAPVSGVKFIHPVFYIALLELESAPEGTYALNMAAQPPSDLAGRSIAVLSYGTDVDHQHANPTLLVQPGQAQQVGQIPGVPGLPGLIHDCTTRTGAAGGPVLDIGTGYAIGVQTHSSSGRGFAQPTWEIARDPHVWAFPIGFRPEPRPSWLSAWEAGAPKQAPLPMKAPAPDRWTVDTVPPIDWAREEPRLMEGVLAAIEPQWALYWAESAGLPLGLVNSAAPPKILWRDLIKRASLAGVLRRLVEALADENPGLAPKLRVYL